MLDNYRSRFIKRTVPPQKITGNHSINLYNSSLWLLLGIQTYPWIISTSHYHVCDCLGLFNFGVFILTHNSSYFSTFLCYIFFSLSTGWVFNFLLNIRFYFLMLNFLSQNCFFLKMFFRWCDKKSTKKSWLICVYTNTAVITLIYRTILCKGLEPPLNNLYAASK